MAAAGVHVVAPCAHEGRCPMDATAQWCHFVQRVQRPPAQRAVKGGAPARTYQARLRSVWGLTGKPASVADGLAPAQDERFSFVVLRRGARPTRDAAQHASTAGMAELVALEEAPATEEQEHDALSDEDEDADSQADEEPAASAAALAAAVAAASSGWARVVRPPRKRSGHVVLDLCTPSGMLQRRVVAASHAGLLGPGSYRLARKARWGDAWPHPTVVRRARIAHDGSWVTALEPAADDFAPLPGRVAALGEQHLE